MPQPLNRVHPNPSVIISTEVPKKYPELAGIVCSIIAGWAWIEKELQLLLQRTLRADDAPAVAMYAVITSHAIQILALNAAAKAVLRPEQFEVFNAVIGAVDTLYKERNKLAHWIWGESPQAPNALILANPDALKRKEAAQLEVLKPKSGLTFLPNNFMDAFNPDYSEMFVYTKDELERINHDMKEGTKMMAFYFAFINPIGPYRLAQLGLSESPGPQPSEIIAESLRQLSTIRLFQESLARVREGQKNILRSPPKSPDVSGRE